MSDSIPTVGVVYHLELLQGSKDSILFSEGHSLKLLTADHEVQSIVGNASKRGYREGWGMYAEFIHITGFAQVAHEQVVVADYENHCLRWVDIKGRTSKRYAGTCTKFGDVTGGMWEAQFNFPTSVVLHQNVLYVTDRYNFAIKMIRMNGGNQMVEPFITKMTNLAPWGLAFNPMGKFAYTTIAHGFMGIVEIELATKGVRQLTGNYPGNQNGPIDRAQFNEPRGLRFIAEDIMLVADKANDALRIIDLTSQSVSTMCKLVGGSGEEVNCNVSRPISSLMVESDLFVGTTRGIRSTEKRDLLLPKGKKIVQTEYNCWLLSSPS